MEYVKMSVLTTSFTLVQIYIFFKCLHKSQDLGDTVSITEAIS